MSAEDAVRAAMAAKAAWNTGRGEWPQMSLEMRIQVFIETFINIIGTLKSSQIVN